MNRGGIVIEAFTQWVLGNGQELIRNSDMDRMSLADPTPRSFRKIASRIGLNNDRSRARGQDWRDKYYV